MIVLLREWLIILELLLNKGGIDSWGKTAPALIYSNATSYEISRTFPLRHHSYWLLIEEWVSLIGESASLGNVSGSQWVEAEWALWDVRAREGNVIVCQASPAEVSLVLESADLVRHPRGWAQSESTSQEACGTIWVWVLVLSRANQELVQDGRRYVRVWLLESILGHGVCSDTLWRIMILARGGLLSGLQNWVCGAYSV